jgi:hypothetical protein
VGSIPASRTIASKRMAWKPWFPGHFFVGRMRRSKWQWSVDKSRLTFPNSKELL